MLKRVWQWLVSRPDQQMRPVDVVLWWEARRIPYNLIVVGVGVVDLALFFLLIRPPGRLPPGVGEKAPIFLILAPFIINILYTGGWVAELLLWLMWKPHPRTGPVLFVVGTAFSIAVFTIPAIVWGLVCVRGLDLFSDDRS